MVEENDIPSASMLQAVESDWCQAITRGLQFLAVRQLPAGNFECRVAEGIGGLNESMEHYDEPGRKGWVSIDLETGFPSILIGMSLHYLKGQPGVQPILDSITRFVKKQQKFAGIWNHYTPDSLVYQYLPHDVDDTACAILYLRSQGIQVTDNRGIFLCNRDAQGRFYTWFAFRKGQLFKGLRHLLVCMKELRHPFQTIGFWKVSESSRYDVDAVVNSNVVMYLGEIPETAAAIRYVVNNILSGNEENCDLYYRNPLSIWYFLSKNMALPSFEPLRPVIRDRVMSLQQADGSFRGNPMDTALALSTLMNLGIPSDAPFLYPSVEYLVSTQQMNGSWPARALTFAGRKHSYGWGSEELTTGIVLEAIGRWFYYKDGRNNFSSLA